jgi:hypothetical protein
MTYDEILARAAVLNNDSTQSQYTDAVLLPYLNTSLRELEEIFELNQMPVTSKTSATIAVPANTEKIGFDTVPTLPSDLIEIETLYESATDQDQWVPVVKRNYLTSSVLGSVQLTTFGIWAWMNGAINVRAAINAIDIKMDYICSLFGELTISQINQDNKVLSTNTFLMYRTAALSAEYIGENPTRATSLNENAGSSLGRVVGIGTKGKQSITIRRRPFRLAFKRWRTLS